MTNFILGIVTTLLLIVVVSDVTTGLVGKANNRINSAILDCVLDGVITKEQAQEIDRYINRSLAERKARNKKVIEK